MCFLKRPLNLTESSLYFWQILRFLCFPHDFWISVKKKKTRLMKSPLYFWQIFVSAEFSDFFKRVQNYVPRYHSTVKCTAVYINSYITAWVRVLWPLNPILTYDITVLQTIELSRDILSWMRDECNRSIRFTIVLSGSK